MSVMIIKKVFQGKGMAGTILRTSFTNFSMLLITTLTSIITARMLGVEGKGELSAILFWPTFISGLVGFGLPTSLIFNLKQDSSRAPDYLRMSIWFQIPVSLVAGVIAWFGLPVWLGEYSATAVRLAQVYTVLTIPMLLAVNLLSAIAQSMDKFNIYNGIRLNVPLFNVVGLIAIWLLGSLTLTTSTNVFLLTTLLVVIYAAVSLRPYLTLGNKGRTIDRSAAKPLFSYGLKVYGMELLGTLYNQFDKIIIVALLTPRDFGLYSVVFALSRVFNTVQTAISNVMFPKVTGMENDKIIRLVARAFRISMTVMAIVVIPSMIIGRFMLGLLFGPQFLEASSTFYLLSIECIIGGGSWVLASSFNAMGRPDLVLIRQLIAISITVGLFFVLAPMYGLFGLSLALVIGAVVRLAITLFQIPRVFKVPLRAIVYDKGDFTFMIQTVKQKISGKGDRPHENREKHSSNG
ncbi:MULTISPECIES: lipopolysaccharide biosynthesis protein [Paenibacillus]|uniref:lipopolysaccharide biosynthesis protein n=1 Tax=Paenibacillus TaxID=44249 RepID=UPI0022B88432|nr:oligosaccharide flippase family protein [Paenibacillus caseinilyticus]MCZ8519312.1 oligosaccharide flippase family protein [Paenibacillus caseinilyticus]